MKTLIINSTNYVMGSQNTYSYRFPQTVKFQAGCSIGVAGISLFNSFQNINETRQNNTLTFVFLGTSYTWIIPDGYYSIDSLNYYLQQQCILNNLYVTTNNGLNFVYFIELQLNTARYATSLNFFAIPTSSQASALGYTKPTGATWSYPSVATTPTLSFSQTFGNLIGLTFGTYPLTLSATNIQYLSTFTPVINPINSIIFCCNLISSKYSIPNHILYTLPVSSSLGSIIQDIVSAIIFNNIIPQVFSTIEISLFDQAFNPIKIIDPELVLTLVISEPSDLLTPVQIY